MEIWKDVKGYEGLYIFSNLGRVKSLNRIINFIDGQIYNYKGKILKASGTKKYDKKGKEYLTPVWAIVFTNLEIFGNSS